MYDLYKVICYAVKRFPEPKSYWSKAHVDKRCAEICGVNKALMRCMDRPFEDISDVLDEYYHELYYVFSHSEKKETKVMLRFQLSAIEKLINYSK